MKVPLFLPKESEMSVPETSHWPAFSRSNHIDFRTACNEAVASAERPLDAGVMEWVAKMPDAHRMFDAHVAGRETPLAPDAILQWLSTEPRWRTMVAEALRDWKAHEDLKRSIVDRIWKWFNTPPAEGKPSPKQQTATVLVASMAATTGAGGTYLAGKAAIEFVTKEKLSVPVTFTAAANSSPMIVNVKTSGPDEAFPIRLAIRADDAAATVPINVSVKSEPLAFVPDQLAALDRLEAAATRASSSLKAASDALPQQTEQIRKAIGEIKVFAPEALDYIAPVTAGLGRIEAALKYNQDQVKELQNLSAQLTHTGKQIEVMNSLTATGRTLTTITATENDATSGTVVWTDAGGAPTSCTLTVSLGKIRRSVEFKKFDVICGSGDAEKTYSAKAAGLVRVGDTIRVGGLPVAVAVDSIVRPMMGANHAVLRLITVTSDIATK